MFKNMSIVRLSVLMTCSLVLNSAAAGTCTGPKMVRKASIPSIRTFINSKKMTVLTFAGYSGAQYQDPNKMMRQATRILDRQDPAKTIINIGATAEGIGAVYKLAKRKGFTTMGMVSTRAQYEHVPLSHCVDYVFYIDDKTWGGTLPGTDQLSPTSAAIVECSTSYIAIGGGDIARDELLAARSARKPINFIPADMNHKIARDQARKKGQAEPTDFRGSVYHALTKTPAMPPQ